MSVARSGLRGGGAGETWYIYRPHWQLPPSQGVGECGVVFGGPAFLTAHRQTYVKRTTALSWEAAPSDVKFVPAGAGVASQSARVVTDPLELSRHSGSPDHLQVELSSDAVEDLEQLDSRWFLYLSHWAGAQSTGAKGGCMSQRVALEDTWLKRSWRKSGDLPACEKIAVQRGAAVRVVSEYRTPSGQVAAADRQLAAEHLEVAVESDTVLRLRSAAPRRPLCKYFSSGREELLASIVDCFSDARFGPGLRDVRGTGRKALGTTAAPGPRDVALLLPHGGFCNSGYVAAHGFQILGRMADVSTVVIVGNNHRPWHKVALSSQSWSTPVGISEPDLPIVGELKRGGLTEDRGAHADEHSIENQLPFLQFLHPAAKIVPIGVGAVDVQEAQALALLISRAIRGTSGVALIGTTDFSHEGPSYGGPATSMEEVTMLTREKDQPLLQAVLDMDAPLLLHLAKESSMCGAGAAAVIILCCMDLGLARPQLLKYLVNTEVTPCQSTTGFASVAFRGTL